MPVDAIPTKKICCKEKKNPAPEQPCKKPEKGCTQSDICLNCPLCSLMIPIIAITEEKIPVQSPRLYKPFNSNYLFHHYSAVWKPPNG
jgi:hypothetical protein